MASIFCSGETASSKHRTLASRTSCVRSERRLGILANLLSRVAASLNRLCKALIKPIQSCRLGSSMGIMPICLSSSSSSWMVDWLPASFAIACQTVRSWPPCPAPFAFASPLPACPPCPALSTSKAAIALEPIALRLDAYNHLSSWDNANSRMAIATRALSGS